jgi:asparagine synthase (glutamine-hydrolysing)
MTGQSESPRASGLYAIIHLDGSAVDPADAHRLGLVPPDAPSPVCAVARDPSQPGALHHRAGEREVALFAGFLDEQADLAASLGLAADADTLTVALAALQRHGADMPYFALGEWSLLVWREGEGFDLVGSMARRDRLCFARVGHRLAVAPGIWALASLPWVGDAMDESGFLFSMMPYHVRQEAGFATPLAHVRQVPPGGSIRLTHDGESIGRTRSWRSFDAPRFTGSQADGVAEAEHLLRAIMRQRAGRASGHGALLSGGLDSSLLTWLLAETLGPGVRFPLLTSAAPEGSGLANELAKARVVGDALGQTVHPVLPPADWSPYRLSTNQLMLGNGVIQSPRHYLYQRFSEDAAALGVQALYDGVYGEHTVTARYPLATAGFRLRMLLRRLRGLDPVFSPRRSRSFVQLAPHRAAALPDAIIAAQRDEIEPSYRLPRPGEPWLFVPGDSMRLGAASEMLPGRVRAELPYRDVRLWRLFMAFPTDFAVRDTMLRAPVRMMLDGRLPDSIRLQPKGSGISPDYFQRLRTHALPQTKRIALLRKADVGEWIDLDWLDANLRRVDARGANGVEDALEVQLTAMNAEMLYWWRSGMPLEG